ncbi:CocE/NonD family hydrolase [Dyadobacter subterraneus]|uniref:CocE/NonD family hydrolase n=1 Tax=Dyadobacter subterraneus TaxID=2773304 RepID=A0ABR9W913_9BACT|nr:CocE/NonD family hydrolase [Dyadobacter subterraneus]MBE9461977.1 CocE/NonD family hydrolase [Dyadobacter subterraneus]
MKSKKFGVALLCLLISIAGFGQQKTDLPDTSSYLIQDSVMIKTKYGITLSAVVVRKKGPEQKLPAALFYFIYSNTNRSLTEAKYAADHGYIGIVADARGKRLSPDKPEPYEHETKDVNAVIDWITSQPWSDGRVGMYGGSYSGFAQWAAAKNLHPALKTIVPYVAAIPGLGLPMENNVFLTANYQWAFYVTNSKYTDDAVNSDNARWRRMRGKWWDSGAAYNRIDSIDGTANPWLQKWLSHPDYDAYWQSMVPYKKDFKNINIPVLTITGYYDDGQVSALEYLRQHYKYNPAAEHYLIIGPYDHFGAQRGGTADLRGYKVDSLALISTRQITYQWLDYVLKGGKKPELLKDKINFEVMSANIWKHTPSLEKMEPQKVRFYLDSTVATAPVLTQKRPLKPGFIFQKVDLGERKSSNNDYYPDPIIKKEIDRSNGIFFMSRPFEKAVSVSGALQGELKAVINKKDIDVGLVLYEITPDGSYFQLSYYLGRASYAQDMSRRKLLLPGKLETIPFYRSRLFSRQLQKGSRLLLVLNIDKNPFAQINYGTGKDVSFETIKDAGDPLEIRWSTQSFIELGFSDTDF